MDSLIKAMVLENEATVVAVSSKSLVQKAVNMHGLSATPSAALGRLLTAGILMSTELKNKDDSLTITINGGGSIGNLVVSATSNQTVRGYVDNPLAEAELNDKGKLNVKGVVGTSGKMTVIKSDGKNKPYVGFSEIVSGEIAEDLAYYYVTSEQKATALSLGVLVGKNGKIESSGGFIIHLLPNASEQTIEKAEAVFNSLDNISEVFKNTTPIELVNKLFDDAEIVLDILPKFKCKCSNSSIKKVIATIPDSELEEIRKEHGRVIVECHFCGKKYLF